MALVPGSTVREVSGLDEESKVAIRHFLQGAVYCWCKNRPDEWFSIRDLMGGENFYWQGTPLLALFEKHKATKDDDDAVTAAGQDAGWMLKAVIDADQRVFRTQQVKQVREYRWEK